MHKRAKYLDMPEYLPLAGAGDFQDFDGFVYVLSCPAAGAVKIGNTCSPSTRAALLQSGNPFELKVAGLVAIAGVVPSKVEFEAHRIGKKEKRHIRGEWFVAEPIEAVEWIIKAAKTKRARYGCVAEIIERAEARWKEEAKAAEAERIAILQRKLGMA